jgi:hypothetical protein
MFRHAFVIVPSFFFAHVLLVSLFVRLGFVFSPFIQSHLQ